MKKKLLCFAFTMGAFVSTNAQIIYTDIVPDTTLDGTANPSTGDSYLLDIDNNGVDDFELVMVNTSGFKFGYVQSNGGAATPGTNELVAVPPGSGTLRQAVHLGTGDTVKASSTFETVNGGNLEFATEAFGMTTGLWYGMGEGYMGVRFDSMGSTYYGWVRLELNATHTTMTIKDYAYESSGGEIVCGEMPSTCTAPTALSTAGLTVSTADLGWTENSTATSWEIQYDVSGFVLGAGNLQLVTTNPYTLMGLNDNQMYDFYVRSICGVGDTSDWSALESFTTIIDDVGMVKMELDYNLYPNPTEGMITIELPESGNHNIEVYNLLGELVYEQEVFESIVNLDLGHLNSGYYVYSISNSSSSSQNRILIK